MIDISNSQKKLAILFLGVFCLVLVAFSIIAPKSPSGTLPEGYVQIVENVSLPILMADQTQQFNLQIVALIRGTPIHQVRVFDTEKELIFRTQGTEEINTNLKPTTYARPLVFENSAVGFLEVDIDTGATPSSSGFWAAVFKALLVATITTAVFFYRESLAKIISATLMDTAKTDSVAVPLTNSKSVFALSGQLMIVIRAQTTDRSGDKDEEFTNLSELSRKIQIMSEIYDAYQTAVAPNIIVLSIKGNTDRSAAHQAAVLCWGLTQLSASVDTQSYLVQQDDFSNTPGDTLAFWSELGDRCNGSKPKGALITNSLADKIDPGSFELSPSNEGFMHVSATSASIQKLWLSQQASANPK